ncbi:Glycosyltransferase involved in cell wall bisynthesis [Chitinophaga sp. CF118]|uniref:glycosyltransferase family 4 protein n=1 Tax=Chitinophaga sp. CF118 TaxID=1884367 RepID=UPI0008F1115A|nr:glycosyltransferase family 4 protein [Chitinophaga sp. CF118]SFF06670.1 Glycosyltransferase involved in cell wall bisynthesis [Chitinophaga sp. CF118]
MRVLYISRATLYSARGGDTIQIENTANELRKLNITVDIKLCNDRHIDYRQYELIHFFNIIRPADIIFHIDKSRLPFVISPIYMDYAQIPKVYKQFMYRFLSFFKKNTQEYFKCLARSLKNGERIMSWKYIFYGHKRSIAYILKGCACLLPNSFSEYERLKKDFKEAGTFAVIPNSIDTSIFNQLESLQREDAVICVARIEPSKNQLNIIRALKEVDIPLTIVGDAAPNHHAYYNECRENAYDKVTFINYQDQETIATLYNKHKTHILASWFETTGLSSLEAAACGCTLVISDKGDTREYFSDNVEYCDPGDLQSIRTAVQYALKAPANNSFTDKIVLQNNWTETAIKTLEAYKKVCYASN